MSSESDSLARIHARLDALQAAILELAGKWYELSTPESIARAGNPALAAMVAADRASKARPVAAAPERRPVNSGALFNSTVDARQSRGAA